MELRRTSSAVEAVENASVAYSVAGVGPLRSYIVRDVPGRGWDSDVRDYTTFIGEGLKLATVIRLMVDLIDSPDQAAVGTWAWEILYRDRVAATITQTKRGTKVELVI